MVWLSHTVTSRPYCVRGMVDVRISKENRRGGGGGLVGAPINETSLGKQQHEPLLCRALLGTHDPMKALRTNPSNAVNDSGKYSTGERENKKIKRRDVHPHANQLATTWSMRGVCLPREQGPTGANKNV